MGRLFWITWCAVGALVALTVLLWPARAQHTTAEHELHQKFYSNWMRPGGEGRQHRYTSCCSQRDCSPATIVMKDGRYYVRNHKMAPNQDVLIPERLLESNQPDPRESPDGQSHACLDHTGQVLCVVLGSQI